MTARNQCSAATEGALLKALKWALPLADLALEQCRQERTKAGHRDITFKKPNGERWVGLYQSEWDEREAAQAALISEVAQSAVMREALEAVQSEIVLTGHLAELVDAALAAQPPAAPVEFDSLSGARKQAMESHASMLAAQSPVEMIETGPVTVNEWEDANAMDVFDHAYNLVLEKSGDPRKAEIAGVHAAITAAYDVMNPPQPPAAPVETARIPKVRTSHHRNKEEAARLQALVNERHNGCSADNGGVKFDNGFVGTELARWCQANPFSAAQMIERWRDTATEPQRAKATPILHTHDATSRDAIDKACRDIAMVLSDRDLWRSTWRVEADGCVFKFKIDGYPKNGTAKQTARQKYLDEVLASNAEDK